MKFTATAVAAILAAPLAVSGEFQHYIASWSGRMKREREREENPRGGRAGSIILCSVAERSRVESEESWLVVGAGQWFRGQGWMLSSCTEEQFSGLQARGRAQ